VKNRLLVWVLESRNLSGARCGFRRHRSALDHLVNSKYHIQNAPLLRQHLIAVSFDLEEGLRHILRTLHSWNVRDCLPLLLSHFLQARYFRVWLGSVLSASYSQENGVPQGLVLSFTLFSISINGLVNAVGPFVNTSLYVDDVATYCSSRSMGTIECGLQGAINRLFLCLVCLFVYFSAVRSV
jgi:potassium voltage-gated channel Eag-related subfamily H protein 8